MHPYARNLDEGDVRALLTTPHPSAPWPVVTDGEVFWFTLEVDALGFLDYLRGASIEADPRFRPRDLTADDRAMVGL